MTVVNPSIFNQFSEVYYSLLGGSDSHPNELSSMFKEYLECPTAGSVESFVRKSREFSRKHEIQIQELWSLHRDRYLQSHPTHTVPDSIPSELLLKGVNRFVYDSLYTLDQLQDDLESWIERYSSLKLDYQSMSNADTALGVDDGGSGHMQSHISPPTYDSVSRDVNIGEGGAEPATAAAESGHATDESHPGTSSSVACVPLDTEYLHAFETHFGRAMFVEEYFDFKQRFKTLDDLQDQLPQLKSRFTEIYIYTRQLYISFTDHGLSQHEFIKKHLGEYASDTFLDMLRDTMIQSPEYVHRMRLRVCQKYREMYDEELHTEDAEILVARLQSKKIPLNYENMGTLVNEYYLESQQIGKFVDVCFQRVLQRPSDMDERTHYIRNFRQSSSHDLICSDEEDNLVRCFQQSICRELSESLEFQDVLKTLLTKQHCLYGRPLYATLKRILLRIEEGAEYDDIIRHIDELVSPVESGP